VVTGAKHLKTRALLFFALLLFVTVAFSACGSGGDSSGGGRHVGGGHVGSGDVGGSTSTARTISLSSSGTGSYSSDIGTSSDYDFYRIVVSTGGTYTCSTSGSTDTVGNLMDSGGGLIASNDDAGSGSNFSITGTLSANSTNYISVNGFRGDTGSYTINISRNSTTTPTTGNIGTPGTDVGARGNVSWTLTWSYAGSEVSGGPDIDLWVKSPSGYTVSGVNRTQGELALDVDDRGGFGSGNGGGPERIYFPGTITAGIYEYGVRWYAGTAGTASYTLRLYNGTTIVGTNSGQLSAPSTTPGSFAKVSQVSLN